METRSVQTAFRFKPQMLAQMKNRARFQGVSLNAYVEALVQKDLDEGKDRYEELFKDLKGRKVNPETVEEIRSRFEKYRITFTQEELDSDERLAYLLSK